MKYEVELAMTGIDNCCCQKSQLTSIPCDQLLVVCSFRKLDYTQYVSPYYTIQYYIYTWSSHWRSYDNKQDWPMYNGPVIRSDPAKINKERRRKIRIPMVMDEMEDRINMLPTRGRARSNRAWFRLSVCVCFLLLYLLEQLNSIVVVIFLFVWYYFRTIY
jgi:hypothetical protein